MNENFFTWHLIFLSSKCKEFYFCIKDILPLKEKHQKRQKQVDRQFPSLPTLIYPQNNQQQQKQHHLISVSEQNYSIQQGNSHIYSPHWSRSLEQQSDQQQYVNSESYISSGQSYTNTGGFQYTSGNIKNGILMLGFFVQVLKLDSKLK